MRGAIPGQIAATSRPCGGLELASARGACAGPDKHGGGIATPVGMGPRACQLVSVSSASGVLRRTEPTRADDNRKPVPMSAIVTIRKHRSDVPDLTPEEHQRRGDAAEAIFREMKRKIAARGRHVPRGFV